MAYFGPPSVSKGPTVPFATTVSGALLAATIQATAVPFLMTMTWSLVLYSWTVVFQLLQLYVQKLGHTCSHQGRALSFQRRGSVITFTLVPIRTKGVQALIVLFD